MHDLVRTQLANDQDVTTKALKADAAFSFYEAVPLIFQMQDVCTPAHILTLVRKAIKEGKADEDTSLQRASEAAFEQFYESTFLKASEDLGELINPGTQRASNDQIAALLWLYNGHNPDDKDKLVIAKMLGTDSATLIGVTAAGTLSAAKLAKVKAIAFRIATLPPGRTLDDKVLELHDKRVAADTNDPAPPVAAPGLPPVPVAPAIPPVPNAAPVDGASPQN